MVQTPFFLLKRCHYLNEFIWQALTWTNGGLVYWYVYVSVGLNELKGIVDLVHRRSFDGSWEMKRNLDVQFYQMYD